MRWQSRLRQVRVSWYRRMVTEVAGAGLNDEVAGDNAGPVGHAPPMRWELMLFVILAAVRGGEERAVVVMGRAVVMEMVGKEAGSRWT